MALANDRRGFGRTARATSLLVIGIVITGCGSGPSVDHAPGHLSGEPLREIQQAAHYELAVADAEWTDLFVRTSGWHTDSGWFGADSSYSVPFDRYDAPGRAGQTKTLWIFADSLTGSESRDVPQHIPYNTLAIMKGSNPAMATMEYIYGTNGNGTIAGGNAGTVFVADTPRSPPYDGSWPRLWLSDGIRLGDNMHIFARLIAGGGELGYTRMGTVLISVPIVSGELDLGSHTKIDSHLFLPANDQRHAVMYGACILDNTTEAGAPHPDGYIYIYGAAWHPSSGDFKLCASRVTESEFLMPGAYRYWDGIGWSTDIDDSVPMAHGVETENSVVPMYDGRYLLVNEQRTNVYATSAKTPWGPFDVEKRQDIYPIPGLDFSGDPQIHAYNAKAHPHLSRPGELLIGYNFNIFPAHPHIFENNVYRPRFIILTMDITDPDGKEPSAADITDTERFTTPSYDALADREFCGDKSGLWGDPLNWSPVGISEAPAWVSIHGHTVEIDFNAPTIGVLHLGYNNDLAEPTLLRISDGGSLTTTNRSGRSGGWDMIGGMRSGDAYLDMTGRSLYHCQGYLVVNHHSSGKAYVHVGPDAEIIVDEQMYFWNGDSETELEGAITIKGGVVWGSGAHLTTLLGNGRFRVRRSVYSIAQAQSDIAVGRFVIVDGELSVATVTIGSVDYTQIATR